ncbi:MAG: Grx4 family monothiol glutaredoxin [Planctomycetota bacterium]|nr:MAG: Grx4 family monothiol glutaredoxin [Planctomycetota bacterium]
MTPQDVERIVKSNRLVLFMKGTRLFPRCGFSARALAVLEQLGKPFEVVDVLSDPTIRPALVAYSGWPTTPQVFVGGELVGGSDIVLELYHSGELQQKVEAAFADDESASQQEPSAVESTGETGGA